MSTASLRRQRGTSLIEGMAAAAVLVIGLLGALQALILATRQNADADKRTRATSIAVHARSAVEAYGWGRLIGAGGPLTTCSGDANLWLPNSGSLNHLPQAIHLGNTVLCVVDLDAFDDGAAAAAQVMRGYRAADRGMYRRFLVVYQDAVASPTSTSRAWREVAVVVSWQSGLGNRAAVTQMMGLYDPRPDTGNETNVEI